MTQLAGKTAIVLGASSAGGIGEAIAKTFAAQGASVVVSGRKLKPLKALTKEIGGEAVSCDITDETQITALFQSAKDSFGKVDIAVNAAGINMPAPISSLTREALQTMTDIQFILSLIHI